MNGSRLKELILTLILFDIVLPLVGCGPNSAASSKLAVTNGTDVQAQEYPSVVKLLRHEKDSESVLCTGTFISNRFVLTAAHCLGKQKEPTFDVEWNDNFGNLISETATLSTRHPLYQVGLSIQPHDIAVIAIDQNSIANNSGIADLPVAYDQPVTIVGLCCHKRWSNNSRG